MTYVMHQYLLPYHRRQKPVIWEFGICCHLHRWGRILEKKRIWAQEQLTYMLKQPKSLQFSSMQSVIKDLRELRRGRRIGRGSSQADCHASCSRSTYITAGAILNAFFISALIPCGSLLYFLVYALVFIIRLYIGTCYSKYKIIGFFLMQQSDFNMLFFMFQWVENIVSVQLHFPGVFSTP